MWCTACKQNRHPPDLGACRWCVQGIVWEQRELSLVQQVAQAEKATLSASRMEDDLASLRADLRLREQVRVNVHGIVSMTWRM